MVAGMTRSQPKGERVMPISVVRVFGDRSEKVAPAPRVILPMTSDRIACRSEKMTDLMLERGNERRDAITRLWVMSGCKACGQCADMAAR